MLKDTSDAPVTMFAAGGVVYRRVGDSIEIILVGSGNPLIWRLPKGLVEPVEEPSQTAIREVQEEAGVLADIELEIGVADWTYEYKGTFYKKVTTYFLMSYVADSPEYRDQEHEIAEWVQLHDSVSLLHFESERNIAKAASQLLVVNTSRT